MAATHTDIHAWVGNARRALAARRSRREREWINKRLTAIGKGGALAQLEAEKYTYTPFEMSLLLNPIEVSAAAEARIMRVARIFESARNMLVVVPLMLTWTSLALAGAAYQQSLSAAKPNAEPFLQQWQEGFPALKAVVIGNWHISLLSHTTRWFTFSSFALADAALFAGLFLLTVIGQILEYWAYWRGNRLAALVETFLYRLNLNALQKMSKAPDEDGLPPWLRELQNRLGQLGDVISTMNQALDASMKSYTVAIDSQERAVKRLVTDTDRVHQSVVELNQLFQHGEEASRIYKRYIPEITKQVSEMAEHQHTSTAALKGMTEMLAYSMTTLGEMVGEAGKTRRIIDRHQDVLNPMPPRRPRSAPPMQWSTQYEPGHEPGQQSTREPGETPGGFGTNPERHAAESRQGSMRESAPEGWDEWPEDGGYSRGLLSRVKDRFMWWRK